MKNTLVTIIVLVIAGCSTSGHRTSKNDIRGFNEFLGEEKTAAMNTAVESFEHFLLINYSTYKSHASRAKAFLEQICNTSGPDSSWVLTTEANVKIIEAFETTGLRKEIWLYISEEYLPKNNINELFPIKQQDTVTEIELGELDLELIEGLKVPFANMNMAEIVQPEKEKEEWIKKPFNSNLYGEFFYGLAKFAPNDSLTQEYVEVKAIAGDISHVIIAAAFLQQNTNFDDPFIKRIMIVEFYFWIMKWDIDRKENNKTMILQ